MYIFIIQGQHIGLVSYTRGRNECSCTFFGPLIIDMWGEDRHGAVDILNEGRCQKKRVYLRLCPKLWVGGSKVPNFLVKITIQLFLLQTFMKCPKTCNTQVGRSYLAIS